MTVKELVFKLYSFDPDLPIVVNSKYFDNVIDVVSDVDDYNNNQPRHVVRLELD